MTLKQTSRVEAVALQDVIDEFLSGEGLATNDILSVEHDSSFLIITTVPQGVDNDVYKYSINKAVFVSDFLISVVPGVSVDEVISFILNGTNIDVLIEFSQKETI